MRANRQTSASAGTYVNAYLQIVNNYVKCRLGVIESESEFESRSALIGLLIRPFILPGCFAFGGSASADVVLKGAPALFARASFAQSRAGGV